MKFVNFFFSSIFLHHWKYAILRHWCYLEFRMLVLSETAGTYRCTYSYCIVMLCITKFNCLHITHCEMIFYLLMLHCYHESQVNDEVFPELYHQWPPNAPCRTILDLGVDIILESFGGNWKWRCSEVKCR